jgi:hypothetical protein
MSAKLHSLANKMVTLNLGVIVERSSFFGVNPGSEEFGTDIRTVPEMCKAGVVRDVEAFPDRCRGDDANLNVSLEFAPPPLDWVGPTEAIPCLPIAGVLAHPSRWLRKFRPRPKGRDYGPARAAQCRKLDGSRRQEIA